MKLMEQINSPADLRRLRPEQLQEAANEIRQYILETMSRVGGHTGASLGAVELAVALHYAFDTPRDRLVWDVGHQAYAHKILTGRRELLPTVKQYGGISGFLRRDESEYDTFGAGHASTSLSAALGMAVARDEGGDLLHDIPSFGERLYQAAKTVKDAIAAAVLPGALVNELGFKYIGYVDGHNPRALVRALEEAKQIKDGPVIVHALTQKGKGYPAREKNYYAWHATGPFDLKTGAAVKSAAASAPSYTAVFGQAMCELMGRDKKVVVLTAAMPDGTGIDKVLEKFPERAYDVGIAEQHCVTFAAGMSTEGLKPVCAIYSTFLQRAFDQIIHDVCLQNLNVKFCMDRAGIVGGDGPTHHGLLDIAYLRGVPNMTLMAPKDEGELRDMLLTMIEHTGPAAMRSPRGRGVGADIRREPQLLEIGKAELLRDVNGGGEVAII